MKQRHSRNSKPRGQDPLLRSLVPAWGRCFQLPDTPAPSASEAHEASLASAESAWDASCPPLRPGGTRVVPGRLGGTLWGF